MPSQKPKRRSRVRTQTKASAGPLRGTRATSPSRPVSSKGQRRPPKHTPTPRTRSAVTRSTRRIPVPKVVAKAGGVTVTEVAELEELRRELEQTAGSGPLRWNANPDDVQRSVAQLVLTLVEFIRKLLERQAIRRMDAGTLTDEQIEDIGRALMALEETILDMVRRFGLSPDDLNLDLGPVGKLI